MTDEVKRWRLGTDGEGNPVVSESEHGPWVEASDFDRVCGERDALAEALRDARDAILSVYTAGFDNLRADACRDGLRAADAALAAWRSVPGSSEPR